MSNKDLYKKTFDIYYDTVIDKTNVLPINKDKAKTSISRRLSLTIASFTVLVLSISVAAQASGFINISGIFKNLFQDQVSQDLVESGIIQELDIVNESEVLSLKLSAFTGDMETPVVLFELLPKFNLDKIDRVELLSQTLSPYLLDSYDSSEFPIRELKGAYNKDNNLYYFSYNLGSFQTNDYYDNIIIRVLGAKLYSDNSVTEIDLNMDFSFTPDKSILEKPQRLELSHSFTKNIYESIAFIDEDDYNNPYIHHGEINATTKEKSIQLTDLYISNYKTAMHGYIMNDTFSEDIILSGNVDEDSLPSPSSIRNQFVLPQFMTYHYWNGLEDKMSHELALVNNEQRIRIFVDDIELAFHENTIAIYPNNLNDNGTYPLYMEFDGFSYDKAQNIEIHFGDKIVVVK